MHDSATRLCHFCTGDTLSLKGATQGVPICSLLDIRVSEVTDKVEQQIAEIEATQAALRDSIAATKGLAEKAERLLKNHKKTLKAIDGFE